MMSRNPDILFITEYIKNVLYFATVRQGKVLKSSADVHYFSIDNELVYENYYSDFGPLNLGCVYKYCRLLNEKLKQFLNKQSIVHYTSIEPKKKANAAFLLGCYGVLYLSLTPKDALKPLLIHGQSYRPFQDATQGDSEFTISLMDCLQAIKKARELSFFNFQDFNYDEYERLDKIQGGDLNWIVPGKFLAFIGPVDYSVSLYHPPEMYIEYFQDNNVKIVIRLNKRMYDGNVFVKAGIVHYDLFFQDGSCPPRHILFKFLQISEESNGAVAVHCKAGLGRTGSLIGSYLIKHYRMTAHEAIGWMRICRPGSVIGHQQAWLESLECWLIKQGNLYRKRTFQDTEKFPIHEYGVYSIAEKALRQRHNMVSSKPPSSPPPPMQRQTRSEITAPLRPQASKIREDNTKLESEVDEKYITSCDLTTEPTTSATQLKGCVLKNESIREHYEQNDSYLAEQSVPLWKKCLCCQICDEFCYDRLWDLAVYCSKSSPNSCQTTKCCDFLDRVAPNKGAETDQSDWRLRLSKQYTTKTSNRGDPTEMEVGSCATRRNSGAGEPRPLTRTSRSPSRSSTVKAPPPFVPATAQRNKEKTFHDIGRNPSGFISTTPAFSTTKGPMIKTLNDARNFLLKTSTCKYGTQREKQLNSSMTVTPHYSFRGPRYPTDHSTTPTVPHVTPTSYSTVSRAPIQPQHKRRLGRSPSPSPSPSPTRLMDQSRATNTPDKFIVKNSSKSALKEALSRLRYIPPVSVPRDGSIGAASVGAASLGARRDAPPADNRASSVRSDERPLATQGDILNSIKFQRRYRDTLNAEKISTMFKEKNNFTPKDKPTLGYASSKMNTGTRVGLFPDYSSREKPFTTGPSKAFAPPTRPTSPKGRSRNYSFY